MRQVGADLEGFKKFIGPKGEKVRVGDLLDSLQLDFEIRHKLSPQITSKLKPLRAAFGD